MKRVILSTRIFFGSLSLLLVLSPFVLGRFTIKALAAPPDPFAGANAGVGVASDNTPGGVCNFIQDDNAQKENCKSCFNGGGAWTALGCIGRTEGDSAVGQVSNGQNGILDTLMKLAVSIGGGVAFLLILYSGFQTMISAGNPEKLHEAKELMTAAISGLLLIIFSVFLLQIIGVNVFGTLPGFSGGRSGPGR